MTSLTFMLVLVPDPVCITPSGNWSAWRPLGNLERGFGNRGRERLRQLAELAVRLRGRPFDESDRADELGRHARPADAEILERALRLGAPKRGRGDADFAEAVLFDAVVGAHG